MLDQLSRQGDIISLEATAGAGGLSNAIGRLPAFFLSVGTYLKTTVGDPLVALFTPKDLGYFTKKIATLNYAALRSTEVKVPAGLKTDLLSYSAELLKAAQKATTFRQEVLDPFAKWLGQKLGDPSSLTSMRSSPEIEGYTKRNLEATQKALLNCFASTPTDTTTYGKAIRRNADWAPLSENLLALQALFIKDDHEAILKQIGNTTDLLDRLIARVQSADDNYQVSSVVVDAIAKTALAVAKEVEFYGLIRSKVLELQATTQVVVQQLSAQVEA